MEGSSSQTGRWSEPAAHGRQDVSAYAAIRCCLLNRQNSYTRLQQAYEEVYVYLSKVKSDIMLKAFLSSAWLSFDIQCEFEEDDEEEESDDETEEGQDDESDDNEKKWFRDKIITIYPGKTEEEYDQLVPKIAEYLTHFQDALQLDDDFDLSKKELQNLRDIMHSSSVTSL